MNTAHADHPYHHLLWNILFTTPNAKADIGIERDYATVIVLHPKGTRGASKVGTRSDACRKSIKSTLVLLCTSFRSSDLHQADHVLHHGHSYIQYLLHYHAVLLT